MTTAPPPAFFGARFSIHPMTDRFVPVILGAIEGLREHGLEVETDDVSTFLGGDRDRVFAVLADVMAKAARGGDHVVMSVLFSHGCPGEGPCSTEISKPTRAVPASGPVGTDVVCQWSIYPLGEAGYYDQIMRAIERTKSSGVYAGGAHFVSRLEGDVAAVLAAVRASFDEACGSAAHVTAHATISANSPSRASRKKGKLT